MKLSILFIFLMFSHLSFSQETKWQLAGEDAAGYKRFIKCAPDYKAGSIIKIWYKDINEAVDAATRIQFTPTFFVEVNCDARTIRLLKGEVVDKKGKTIFEQAYDESAEKVLPNSMKEITVLKACSFFRK